MRAVPAIIPEEISISPPVLCLLEGPRPPCFLFFEVDLSTFTSGLNSFNFSMYRYTKRELFLFSDSLSSSSRTISSPYFWLAQLPIFFFLFSVRGRGGFFFLSFWVSSC